jgi:retron-type reverse transcriptase
MSLADVLDLEKAYRRVQQDKRDDTWPDIINYRDYQRVLEQNLEILRNQIATPNDYQAKNLLDIDIPKKGFTLRPGAVPLIDDRIAYQAIADFLSPHFNPEPCVFSNILSPDENSSRMFLPGVQLWLNFQRQIEELCQQYPYIVETDITAYFEHISHDRLIHRIQDLFEDSVDDDVLQQAKNFLLRKLFWRWSKGTRYGIPQVNDASSFFANVFLDELDKWMIRQGYPYLRYVDDMRIFATDEPGARRALAEIIVKLREMGLHVASGKTKVRRTDEVLQEMRDSSEQMNAIEEELSSRIPERLENAATMLEEFIESLIENPDNFNDRQFRYCVNRFKRLKVNGLAMGAHETVANEVLNRLYTMPYSTDVFVDYLSLFHESEDVQVRTIEFLEGPYNIYPWQELQLIELLIRLDIFFDYKDRALSIARTIARDTHKHPACREKAFIFWGKNGDYADRREIRGIYFDEPDEGIKRSILYAIQEMQIGERNNFFQGVVNDSDTIRMTAEYIRDINAPTYHFYNPPAGFEISEDWASNDLDDLPMPSA